MKRVLYLTFFFEPDLSAGSFRNTAIAKALSEQMGGEGEIMLYTTQPNRYHTYSIKAPAFELRDNLSIVRIPIPAHKNTFASQIRSYRIYYKQVLKLTRRKKFDIVFVSSGRFFTSYLGYTIAKKQKIPLYLDIRDIFSDTLKNVLSGKWYKMPVVKILEYLERKPYTYASHINLVSEGFKRYFTRYPNNYSFFTNGIDEEFLQKNPLFTKTPGPPFIITYAGNIGEGQGLEKIIPEAARILGPQYHFKIIGDGGLKRALEDNIREQQLKNVEILLPVSRDALLKHYAGSHFLFLHLNDYAAFENVLPSKIFEYAAYPFPIIAGVSGYAREFMLEHLKNIILFSPGKAGEMAHNIQNYQYAMFTRDTFIADYKRSSIAKAVAEDILRFV